MLESNRAMLELCAALGFAQQSRTGAEVTVMKRLK
jgi:hypothetical protein